MLRRRGLLASLVLAALALAAPDARAANLWIVWEPSPTVAACRPVVEDMFACALGATQLTSLATGYPAGRALTLAGSAVVRGCYDGVHAEPDYACAITQAGFDFRDGDVLEYILPDIPAAAHGINFPLTVELSGRMVHGNGAWVWNETDGDTCDETTTTALHEAYEASSEQSAADCCIGESPAACPGCSPSCQAWVADGGLTPAARTLVCPSGTFSSQPLSPASDEFTPASCTALVVDATALCAQPRAVRETGRCTPGGDLETCDLATAVHSCGGAGCATAPAPHCDAPLAGYCTIAYPHVTYGAQADTVTVTCVNDGASAWPGGLALVTAPDADSPLQGGDTSWRSARSPAAFGPDAVPPGGRATLTFVMHAPRVTAPTTLVQGLALRAPDGTTAPFPAADELAMSVLVLPCGVSSSVDAGDAGDARTSGFDTDASWTDVGGGCELSFPSVMCPESNVTILGRCQNQGTALWPDNLEVASEPPDGGALRTFATATYATPRGACEDVRRFAIEFQTPYVIGSPTLTQQWSLVPAGGGAAVASFAATFTVSPDCHEAGLDAGPDATADARPDATPPRRDAGVDADAAAAALDEAPHRETGCACRATPAAGHPARGAGALALAGFALAYVRRRRARV